MNASADDETPLRRLRWDRPRRKLALVLVVVTVNLSAVIGVRGDQIHQERLTRVCKTHDTCLCGHGADHFVPPWEWTSIEWRESFPWK